jgi:transposase
MTLVGNITTRTNFNRPLNLLLMVDLSSYDAALQYDVPRGTIARHVAHYKRTGDKLRIGEGRPTALTSYEESLLVTVIQTSAEAGFPLDKSDLLELITQ